MLNISDKIAYNQAIFMHQYRNKKLPTSFENMFLDITDTNDLQTRNNDYNFLNKFLSSYNSAPDCDANCFVCNN